MAYTPMAAPKETRFQLVAPASFHEDVEKWGRDHGGLGRSEAIRTLVRLGMKCDCGLKAPATYTPKPQANGKTKAITPAKRAAKGEPVHLKGLQLGPTKPALASRLKPAVKRSKWALT